jgi:hypothetical protein|tara:strand:- start:171 stop:467 length:297 start_codon:yes stop_codon:yes gene_type:complete
MKIPPVAPIFPAIFPKDKEDKREVSKKKEISVGDLVKEHTKHSKKRTGLVYEVRKDYWLGIKWLDGSTDHLHNIYEVTKFINGEYKDILQEYIRDKKW